MGRATRRHLEELASYRYVCPVGELAQLYSAREASDNDTLQADLHDSVE